MITFLRTIILASFLALLWTGLARAQLVSPPWWNVDWWHAFGFMLIMWASSEIHEREIHRREEEEMLRDAEWYEEDYRSWYK